MSETSMTLNDAIKHCKEAVERMKKDGTCKKCIDEHEQLARWLEELLSLRAVSQKRDGRGLESDGE